MESPEEAAPGTLGAVLYSGSKKSIASEKEWAALVRAIAAGDQRALHALFERTQRLVFTLAVRIAGNRETAEELTVDVFHDVWRRASGYDPANGTVLGWVMNQARSRAIDRLRFEQRRKRVQPDELPPPEPTADSQDALETKQQAEVLRRAVAGLSSDERQAVEAAYYAGLTHAEAAERLKQPLGTVKTRIRSALQKLRRQLPRETQ